MHLWHFWKSTMFPLEWSIKTSKKFVKFVKYERNGSFEIQYRFVNFILQERMFLPCTRDCNNNCWWCDRWRKPEKKKLWRQSKFDYCEKTVKVNKVYVNEVKPLARYFRCYYHEMTLPLRHHNSFSTCILKIESYN